MSGMSPIEGNSPAKPSKIVFPSFAEPNNDFQTPEAEPEPKPRKHNFMSTAPTPKPIIEQPQSKLASPIHQDNSNQINIFDDTNNYDDNEEQSPKSFQEEVIVEPLELNSSRVNIQLESSIVELPKQ